MYETKNILCAIALSDNADRILAQALREAQAHGTDVQILHVLPSASEIMSIPVAMLMGEEKFRQLIEERMADIRSTIKEMIEQLKEKALTGDMAPFSDRITDIIVVEGDPVIEILDAIKRLQADMLVIGTHAKGLTEHTFMGDVAHKILKRTRVPVLLVPAVNPSASS